MKIQRVPLEWVNVTWPMVKPHFKQVVEHMHGDYTLDHIQAMVATGQWMLLVGTEDEAVVGAATVMFYNRPTERVAFITALAGRLLVSVDGVAQLKALVAAQGATTLEGAVRESVARLLSRYGFVEKTRIVKLPLLAD